MLTEILPISDRGMAVFVVQKSVFIVQKLVLYV